MPFDFYLSRLRRDDDGPDILRVDNCSEVDIAGNFYKQNGKYYDQGRHEILAKNWENFPQGEIPNFKKAI